MNKRYLLVVIFSILFATSYSQTLPPGCSGALPFCAGTSSTGISFPNTTNSPSPGSYSCLATQPNAAWYYLQISQSGNLTFTIRQFNTAGNPIDVDFIAWGPFATPTCGASNLNASTQVGCSYSAAATETFTINNAIVGQYYMVMMTNFANSAGTITLAQNTGTGATSCDIVCPLTIAGGGVSDCRDYRLTANYINSSQVGTTFAWTFNNVSIPSATGPNFVAGPPRSNNSTVQTLAYGAGNYCVTARSPGCSTTQSAVCTTINRGTPVPFNPPNTITACNNSTFDLTQNTNVLLQGLPGSATNYSVRYNVNATNAATNLTPIPTWQQSVYPGADGQTIFATVMDSSGSYCYAVAQFTLRFVTCAFATTNTGPICAGGTFNLSATDPGVGPVTYTWAGPNGFTATGANVSNVPTPTGTPPFSYVCTATPSTVGVAPLTSTTIVTVNPIPVLTATPVSNSICTGSITDIPLGSNVSGTTFSWTAVETNATGSSNGIGTNIAQTLTVTGNAVGTVDYLITPSANSCTGTPVRAIISVKPIPVVVATPTPAAICSGSTSNIILTSTPTGATFAWTAIQTDASGASASSGSIIAQALSSPGSFIGSVDYTITPTLNSCVGLPVHSIITVNPTPVAVATPVSTTICSATATNIPLTSLVTGATFAWTVVQNNVTGASAGNGNSIAQTLTATTANPGSVVYTITPTANGCTGVPINVTINVTPIPTAAISYSGTPFCTSLTTGQAVTLTGTSAYTGGAYSSTTGLSVDATTGAITPSTSTAGNYVVTYTAPASAGCASVPTTTNVVITALPTATISYTGTPFCTTLTTGQAVTLTGTAGYTGGVYSGTAGLTIDATTGAVTPSTSTPGNHTITYTIAAAAGCAQVVATANIIVNPIPVAIATPSAVTICSLDTTNIAISSNAIGATYVWTSTTTNATGASSASGTTIADALTVTGNTPGIVVYTITPTGSGCTGLPITATVLVNPLPTATISGNARICYNTSSTISFSGTPNATVTYTVNGGANQTTILDNVGQGIVSTGNITATTTYQLVSVRSAGMPSCSQSQTGSVVVSVIPVPLVNTVVSSPTICSGQPTGISLSSNVTTATYNWTITQSGVIGASLGNGSIISQILTATGVVPGTVTYSVMANEGVCQGPATPITITVNPIPVVTPSTMLQSVCSGSVSPIQLTSNVAGTTFNWNVVQTNVTGANNGTGNVISQTLTTTSNNIGEAVYSVTPTVGGCPGLPVLVTVRVNPIPVATANAAVTTICSSSTTNIALTGSVAGTTFSWTVIQSGIFGASSGTGNSIAQTLTTVGTTPGSVIYTITPSINGCSGAPITVTIIVNPTPEVFGSSTSTICSGETPNITLFPSIAATTFAWTVNALNVSGAQAGTGVVINDVLTASPNLGTAIYTVTPTANGCSGTQLNITVTVNPAPAPQINDGVICVNQATGVSYKNYILDTNLSNATYDFAWYFNGVVINGAVNNSYAATQAGTYSVVVTNTATGCKSAVTQANVTASFPGTVISTTETLAFSDNATITVDVTGGNATFLYSLDNGPTQSSNVFTDVSPGSHVITVTDANGCTNLTKLVSIIGYPTYFTPNGDGYHETWNIIGLGDTAKVYIFDRYGKLIKQISPTGEGWDGTYNGEPLMSTDYWFTVDYSEPQTGERRAFRSHFSLKR